MVRGAAALFSAKGAGGTSFSEIIAASGAPRGSIYHHFPDGKRQLAEEAVRWTAEPRRRVPTSVEGEDTLRRAGLFPPHFGDA